MTASMAAERLIAFLGGMAIVLSTINAAVRSFVLPRSSPDSLTRMVFMGMQRLFALQVKRSRSYLETDRVMAMFAPAALLALLPVWLGLVLLGYSLMFWAAGTQDWYTAFRISGSSLLTLGFTAPGGWLNTCLEFTEATLGLILVALLIAYLPTMYSAFSRRESKVTLLEVRAGDHPWAITMLERYHRIHGLEKLGEEWQAWETWFADLEESHTSLPALVFFRSPQPGHSWITAAGTILDAGSIMQSSVDIQSDPRASLCIRAGYLALRRIADFFKIQYNENPHFPEDPISITREEFDQALDQLGQIGMPLKADRDQAWLDFAGWRVNYDRVLTSLTRLTIAPPAPWSGSRFEPNQMPPLFLRKE